VHRADCLDAVSNHIEKTNASSSCSIDCATWDTLLNYMEETKDSSSAVQFDYLRYSGRGLKFNCMEETKASLRGTNASCSSISSTNLESGHFVESASLRGTNELCSLIGSPTLGTLLKHPRRVDESPVLHTKALLHLGLQWIQCGYPILSQVPTLSMQPDPLHES
jgi:hypothetical protein